MSLCGGVLPSAGGCVPVQEGVSLVGGVVGYLLVYKHVTVTVLVTVMTQFIYFCVILIMHVQLYKIMAHTMQVVLCV